MPEGQILDERDQVTERGGERTNGRLCDSGPLDDQAPQRGAAGHVDGGRLHRHYTGRVGAAVERWHVVERVTGAEQSQCLFFAFLRCLEDLDQAAPHIVQRAAILSGEQDDVAARVAPLAGHGGD